MKLSHSFILLSSTLHMQSAGAQNATSTTCTDFEAAVATCITTHNCTGLDMTVASDCSDIKEHHCEHIEGCTECKEEFYALYDCEHGATCGVD
ncbi:hypothetical protein ACHAWT_005520, partial [Skeletonema menzelii]